MVLPFPFIKRSLCHYKGRFGVRFRVPVFIREVGLTVVNCLRHPDAYRNSENFFLVYLSLHPPPLIAILSKMVRDVPLYKEHFHVPKLPR